MKRSILILCLCILVKHSQAQKFFEPADSLNVKRVAAVSAVNSTLWAGTITGLYFVWYKDFEQSKWHTFNDGHEWMQMDKVGHSLTAWNFARVAGGSFKWSGLNDKTSALIGAGFSVGYMTTFEMLDGISADWGFSWWDVAANTAGSAMYFGQEYFWQEQKVKFKFSFHKSNLAHYRPAVLGSDFVSRTLKDYNGQTYWLSFNPITMVNPESKVPKWINLSIGYSIQDHLVGAGGSYTVQYSNGAQASFTPYRQWYLSFDIDWEDIPVRSKALKFLLRTINVVKLPFPALEFSNRGVKMRPLYF